MGSMLFFKYSDNIAGKMMKFGHNDCTFGCVAKNVVGMISSAFFREELRSTHHEQAEFMYVASFPGRDDALVRSLVSARPFELAGSGGNDDGTMASR